MDRYFIAREIWLTKKSDCHSPPAVSSTFVVDAAGYPYPTPRDQIPRNHVRRQLDYRQGWIDQMHTNGAVAQCVSGNGWLLD
jgi:hypothetical protein